MPPFLIYREGGFNLSGVKHQNMAEIYRVRGGKNTVVVVVSDIYPEQRDWIITAYITRKLGDGGVEWQKK